VAPHVQGIVTHLFHLKQLIHQILVLQHLVEPGRIHCLRRDHVPDQLAVIFDHIRCNHRALPPRRLQKTRYVGAIHFELLHVKVSFRRELGIVDSSPDLQNGSDHGAPPHQHRRARQELQTADFSSVWFPLVEAGSRRLRQFDHQKQFSARRWRHHRGTTTTSPLLIFVSGECPCRRGFNTACDPLESKLSTPG
jgi:hypothetical protein